MTFKDLQRLVQSGYESDNIIPELQKLQGKPFWHFDQVSHREKHRINRGDDKIEEMEEEKTTNGIF